MLRWLACCRRGDCPSRLRTYPYRYGWYGTNRYHNTNKLLHGWPPYPPSRQRLRSWPSHCWAAPSAAAGTVPRGRCRRCWPPSKAALVAAAILLVGIAVAAGASSAVHRTSLAAAVAEQTAAAAHAGAVFLSAVSEALIGPSGVATAPGGVGRLDNAASYAWHAAHCGAGLRKRARLAAGLRDGCPPRGGRESYWGSPRPSHTAQRQRRAGGGAAAAVLRDLLQHLCPGGHVAARLCGD